MDVVDTKSKLLVIGIVVHSSRMVASVMDNGYTFPSFPMGEGLAVPLSVRTGIPELSTPSRIALAVQSNLHNLGGRVVFIAGTTYI